MRRMSARNESVRMSHSRSRSMFCRKSPAKASSAGVLPPEPEPMDLCSSCWQHGALRMYWAFHSTPFASASSVAVSHA